MGLAVWGSRMVQSLLFGVAAMDPLTLVGMAALLLAVGRVAAALPAVPATGTLRRIGYRKGIWMAKNTPPRSEVT